MSIILNEYDEENRLDRTWFDSSNVLFSICDDKVDALKEVTVCFSDGRTYSYSEVKVNDYLMFRNSLSQGKDLFKYIAVKDNGIPRYKTTKLENTDLKQLENQKQLILESRAEKLKEFNKTLVESSVVLEPEFAKHIKDNIEDLLMK